MKGKSRKELTDLIGKLKKGPLEDKLIDYFDGNTFISGEPLDVYGLAASWKEKRKEMLDSFLHLVGLGFLELNWVFHCPHCGAVAHESLSLKSVHEIDHCDFCKVDFKNTLDQNVEVFFFLRNMQSKKMEQQQLLRRQEMMKELENNQRFFWQKENTLLGSDCIHNHHFRDFLGGDLLDLSQSLTVSYSAMLFTDIKGSTALYEKLGDGRAYRLVRDHFNILFHETELNGGAVVKTIGDSVMSSFANPHQAIKTALAMQWAIENLNKSLDAEQQIEIKIGLHGGPAIMVTLNNRLDYFGSTVNKAAKIQGLAHAGEILLSAQVFDIPEVQQEIKKYAVKLMKRKIQIKGLEEPMDIYRIPKAT